MLTFKFVILTKMGIDGQDYYAAAGAICVSSESGCSNKSNMAFNVAWVQ